jgi:hypothetical protein
MRAGETFLLPNDDDHLWAIISDPVVDPQRVVVVLFVSWTEKYDQACVLNGGEHPFIKHPTCVQYPGAALVSDATLEARRQSGELKMKAPLSPDLLALIRQRADRADLRTRIYEVLREQGYVP